METYVARNTSVGLLLRVGALLHEGVGTLRTLAKRVADRGRSAKNLDALTRMSERELHDIGISRSSIRAIADGLWSPDQPQQVRSPDTDGITTISKYRATDVSKQGGVATAGGVAGRRNVATATHGGRSSCDSQARPARACVSPEKFQRPVDRVLTFRGTGQRHHGCDALSLGRLTAEPSRTVS